MTLVFGEIVISNSIEIHGSSTTYPNILLRYCFFLFPTAIWTTWFDTALINRVKDTSDSQKSKLEGSKHTYAKRNAKF